MKKRIDVNEARAKLLAVVAKYELEYQVAVAILDVLDQFDGRPLNIRIAAAVLKKLSQRHRIPKGERKWKVKWKKTSSTYYLSIHGGGILLKDSIQQIVALHGPIQDRNLRFDYETYRKVHALPYLQLGETIKHLEQTLQHLETMAVEWNRAAENLEQKENMFGLAGQYILPVRLLTETTT